MAVMKKIKIQKANNLLTFEEAQNLKEQLFNPFFPFGFVENLAHPEAKMELYEKGEGTDLSPDTWKKDPTLQYGFFHTFFADGEIFSQQYDLVDPIFEAFTEKFSIKVKELLRVRVRMTTKVANESIVNHPHVDLEEPHKVLLYYVNDSDGDTIFFKKNKDKLEEIHRETPVMGSAVYFDGSTHHASSTPTKVTRRITINFNFR